MFGAANEVAEVMILWTEDLHSSDCYPKQFRPCNNPWPSTVLVLRRGSFFQSWEGLESWLEAWSSPLLGDVQ